MQINNEQRLDECLKVFQGFKQNFGYMVNRAFTLDEIHFMVGYNQPNGWNMQSQDFWRALWYGVKDLDGLPLGYCKDGEYKVDIKLSNEDRKRHIIIFGKTGTGKTIANYNMMKYDLQQGNGFAALCNEKDAINWLLSNIPEHRINDVVYFNPIDYKQPIGLNLFYLNDEKKYLIKKDECYYVLINIMDATSDTMQAPLKQLISTLILCKDGTLEDIPVLLNKTYPRFTEIVKSLDSDLKHYWLKESDEIGDSTKRAILNRLHNFLFDGPVKNVCCQKECIDFRNIIDNNKIFIANLCDIEIGKMNSDFLGKFLLSFFQLAALSRIDILNQRDRKPFYIYADEIHRILYGESIKEVVERLRKYNVALIASCQHPGQLGIDVCDDSLHCIKTFLTFETASKSAKLLANDYLTENEDLETKPLDYTKFVKQKIGSCHCKISEYSFPLFIYSINEHVNQKKIDYIIKQSQKNYGTKQAKKLVVNKTPEKKLASKQLNLNSFQVKEGIF